MRQIGPAGVSLFMASSTACALLCGMTPAARAAGPSNQYAPHVLVANDARYNPEIVDPNLLNPWGISIRPAGAGGHFWMSNNGAGNTTTYIGDAPGIPLYQDALQVVDIPAPAHAQPGVISRPTGQVFNGSTDFQVSDGTRSGASKFLFDTLDGTIAAWTTDMPKAVTVIDRRADQRAYTGLAVTTAATGNRLYAANFNPNNRSIDVYDGAYNKVPMPASAFSDPAVPDDYAAYNVQHMNGKVYVAWAIPGPETEEAEAEAHAGSGYVSTFDANGALLDSFTDHAALNAPWGMALAPADFGALSNTLLIGNFGDGTIAGFDQTTHDFVDYLRDEAGDPLSIDGLWGMTFGNGDTLGYADRLYYTAGPNLEADGVFGSIRAVPEPTSVVFLALAVTVLARRRRND